MHKVDNLFINVVHVISDFLLKKVGALIVHIIRTKTWPNLQSRENRSDG